FAYCGSACAALGWDLISTAKTARYNSGATIRMCTSGKSGCSDTDKGSNPLSSGTVALGAGYSARTVYGVSWGRIAAPRVYTATGASGGSYFYLTGEGETLLGSGQTSTNVDVAASHKNDYAVVYNTRRYAWATIYGSCSFVTGGSMGYTDWQTTAHTSGAYLRYKVGSTEYFVTNGDETTAALATGEGDPAPLGKVQFIPYQNYTDYGWWCDTFDTSSYHGWTLTINPNTGTYTGDTTRHMLYGSRVNNNIGVPTKTGYIFLGWYDKLGNEDAKKIYDSSGKAVKLSSGTFWNYPESYQEYAIWVSLSNVTAYAHWEEMSSRLTYYTNGHGSISGDNPEIMKYSKATYAKSAPSATGYTFVQWCTKSDGTGNCFAATGQHESVIRQANTTSYLSSDMALYAIWRAKTYTLTFKPSSCFAQNCSSIPNLTATATYGKALTAPSPGSSTPSGYTFLGWYVGDVQVFKADLSPSSSSTYWSNGKWSYNGDVTLTGKWQR
ncbi:MAG: InlB B-repeat-containing protein, partial [Bacilli bacterium]|nr:InlB B-repeat-containing protein [Bacilli bacterium]